MHHLPAGPPLSARLAALLRRLGWRLRDLLPAGSARRRPAWHLARRMALGLVCTVAVTAVVLAVPVVSGAGGEKTPVALDSSSTTSAGPAESEDPVVVMGVDGSGGATSSSASRGQRPAGSATTDPATGSPGESAGEARTGAAALPGTTAPGTTGAAPGTTTRASAPGTAPGTSTGSTSAGSRAPSSGSGSPSSAPPPSESPAPPSPAGADLEAQVVALVAQARAEAGCASSEPDPALTDVARRHSADMAAAGGLQALDLAAWAVRGAAVGQGPANPNAVVAQWLADPATSAQLLDCAATGLGAGVADGPWYTVVLA